MKKVQLADKHGPKWAKDLEDIQCSEGTVKITFKGVLSEPPSRVIWMKNKIEIFPGAKFTMQWYEEGNLVFFV